MSNKECIVMVGLPRSGKSTIARSLGYPIVEKDAIRLSLHGKPFLEEAEPMVDTIADIMVASLFESGHDKVIIDECHVRKKYRDRWRAKGYLVTVIEVTTSKDECLKRAVATGQEYLVPVIEDMASVFQEVGEDE